MTAPATNVNIHLTRINGHIPWGFRMSGGADFGSPLTIQRVSTVGLLTMYHKSTYHTEGKRCKSTHHTYGKYAIMYFLCLSHRR